jgi:hypothetical protein
MPRSIGLSGPFFVLVLGTSCQGLYIGVSILPTLVLCCGKTAANRPFVVSALAEKGWEKMHKCPETKKKYFAGNLPWGPKNVFARKIRPNGAREGTYRWCR